MAMFTDSVWKSLDTSLPRFEGTCDEGGLYIANSQDLERASRNIADMVESKVTTTNIASPEIPSSCKVCPIGDNSDGGNKCNNHINGSRSCHSIVDSFAQYFRRG